MLKNTMLFFACSCMAIHGAFADDLNEKNLASDVQFELVDETVANVEQDTQANDSTEATLSCDEAQVNTDGALSSENAENTNDAQLCDKNVIIEPEDGALSCNSCKDILSCSCHGKGKTKELASDADSEKNQDLACACLSDNETEV